MLQRAACNAYSWWWASHIRTKQSKWLEQNLQDVEEKVNSMLRIVEQEGDSFAKRAEMYYKKRPELINFVEETYRAYRALAERYDHLSKDLQSANRTIATVFPEQVQLSLESDDDESVVSGTTAPSPISEKSFRSAPAMTKSIPKAPKLPKPAPQSVLVSKREQLRRNVNAAAVNPSSGLSKDDALREIDTLQKEILSLQTEKEFVKSSYESRLTKFWDIENKISEFQVTVCKLQDEFGIGTVIEDHEARSLMAGTALKSCAEALSKLQEEQERSMEEAKAEYQRIKEAQEKLESLKELKREALKPDQSDEKLRPKRFDNVVDTIEVEDQNPESLKQKIKEQIRLDSHSTLTEPELTEKIDDLVERIMSLETVLCSQNALVKRLRQENDDLHAQIRSLEEDKEKPVEGSELIKRIRELEEELSKVKGLNKELVEKKNSLNTEITEASCNLDHLKQKLQDVKPAEEGEYTALFEEAKVEHEEMGPVKEKVAETDARDSSILSEEQKHEEDDEKHDFSQTADSALDTDIPDMRLEGEDGSNWRQLYMNNIEERERILVEEYTLILRDYKDIKMKLAESEKKNRDNIFELASLVRELRDTIAAKDTEIQHLRKLLASLQSSTDENGTAIAGEIKQDYSGSLRASDLNPDRRPLFHHIYSRNLISEKSLSAEDEIKLKLDEFREQHGGARVEGRFRTQLDALLEANLDFWLRFSTSFHQIQKFQTSIKDLQGELTKLMGTKKQNHGDEKSSHQLKSDARPLYKHMREIQTELTLWLEHSAVFQEELRSRFTSLNSIQEEITRAGKDNDIDLSDFKLAKFQGEVLNMKQENSKVAEELLAGVHRVRALKVEIEKALTKLDKEFGLSESKSRYGSSKGVLSKPRIPLQSFLFGIKLKKQKQKPSIFACVNPALRKDHSTLPGLPE